VPCLPNSRRPTPLLPPVRRGRRGLASPQHRGIPAHATRPGNCDPSPEDCSLPRQLDAVKTPEQAAAIEHEIQFSTTEAERLENEEFASLERTEAQEAVLAQAPPRLKRLPRP